MQDGDWPNCTATGEYTSTSVDVDGRCWANRNAAGLVERLAGRPGCGCGWWDRRQRVRIRDELMRSRSSSKSVRRGRCKWWAGQREDRGTHQEGSCLLLSKEGRWWGEMEIIGGWAGGEGDGEGRWTVDGEGDGERTRNRAQQTQPSSLQVSALTFTNVLQYPASV